MSFLSKLFGYCGKVRFEGITIDGKEFDGTVEIETFNLSNEEIEDKIKQHLYVDTGIKAKTLKIIGAT